MSRSALKLFCKGMLAVIICVAWLNAEAQRRDRRNNVVPAVKKDSGSSRGAVINPNLRNDVPKPYKEVIPSRAHSYKSFITAHKVDEKYFLEIPDSLLGREILVVNQISAAPADFRSKGSSAGYAGDIIGQLMFHFEKGAGNRLLIKAKSYKERSLDSSANGLARLIERNNYEPILNSYPIKALNDSLHSSVIEITDQLNQDNLLFGFSAAAKTAAGLTAIVPDRSYIAGVKNYEDDISFSFTRTYNKTAGGLSTAPLPYTFQLKTGMILLPETAMVPRMADNRTGYQKLSYLDFDDNPLGVAEKSIIYRWRLEPADRQAYLSGKLSAPVQPIRIYIDPAFPVKWQPYVKAGIESWNIAFEKAGFKNAIEVVQETYRDSASYHDNLHRNTVVFLPGEGEQPGNVIADPRSGEILNVQLRFYLSTIDNLYKKYFIQAGALDKAANRPVFDDATMGRLVQAYTMQAMGSLLGLGTNAGASNVSSIQQLRNNGWLKSNAFNGSAMDPVLVNYVAQPEDQINVRYLLPQISDLDAWMINWGYRIVPENEAAVLEKWILDRAGNGSDLYVAAARPGAGASDPRAVAGDLSNDAVQASVLGIKNLKVIVPHLLSWTSEPASDNQRAAELYEALLDQYREYAMNVVNQLGGVYISSRNSNQPGALFRFVSPETQKKALQFLQEQVFQTPQWLADKQLYSRTTASFDSVMNIQRNILENVMSRAVLSKLQVVVTNNASSAYHPLAFLNDLSTGIFSELKTTSPVSLPRRELQRVYIAKLVDLLNAFKKTDNDLPAVLNAHAKNLLDNLKRYQASYTGFGKAHVSAMYEQLYTGLYNPVTPSTTSPTIRRI